MAADDQQIDDAAADGRGQAETAARDRTQAPQDDDHASDPAELRRELDRLRSSLRETNRKATADRLRKEELEREREEREAAKLSDEERRSRELRATAERNATLEREAEALKAQLLAVRVDHAIEREAAAIFEYPEDIPKLIDRDRIEVDEATGKFVGVKEAVKRLADQRPGLLRQRAGGGTPPREGPRRPGHDHGVDFGRSVEDRARQQIQQSAGFPRL